MSIAKTLTVKITAISLLACTGLMGIGAIGASASDGPIRVFMNHARILKFDEAVSSVIVGNSGIADVTVSDPRTVVLTAKSFGTTNLVILDNEGEPVLDKRIVVSVDEENSVRIFKQIDRTVLSCSPICEEQKATQ